jgi:DnaJ-class molecular chaperone
MITCPSCNGTGQPPKPDIPTSGPPGHVTVTKQMAMPDHCQRCGGTGQILEGQL